MKNPQNAYSILTPGSRIAFPALLFLVAALWGIHASDVRAQKDAPRYSVALEGLPLSDAFDQLVELTSINVALDFELIDGKTTQCNAENALVDEILTCVVSNTGLQIRRLPSGTYVVVEIDGDEAGHLTGRVVDFESGEPLIYAHVLLADANTGDITNSSGRFSFSRLNPGAYQVAVTYIGYKDFVDTVRVQPGENTRIELEMQVEPLVSAPIVVNGLLRRLPSESLGADTVDATSFNQTGTGGDVLRSVGTVIGVRVGDAMADVHVQGGGAGEHQYRLDGAPVFVPIPNGGVVGPFSVFALDKFTVHKAGFGVTYGSSLSGVIEVGHRLTPLIGNQFDIQVDPLSINGLAMGTIGDRNQVGVNWMVAGRKGLWSLYRHPALADHFNQWSSPDLFLLKALSPVRNGMRYEDYNEYNSRRGFSYLSEDVRTGLTLNGFQDDFDFYDIHAAMRVHLGASRSIHASLYQGGNSLGDEEVLTGQVVNGNTTVAEEDLLTMSSEYSWNNTVGQLRYEHIVGDRTFVEWSSWYSEFDLSQDMSQNTYLDRPFPEGENYPGKLSTYSAPPDSIPRYKADDQNSVSEFGVKSEVNHSIGSRHFLTIGLEGIRSESAFQLNFQSPVRSNNGAFSFASVDALHWRWSGYLEDSINFSERTNLSLGVRLTYLNNHKTVFAEPRVSFRYDASESFIGPWAFKAAFGVYRQFVNQFDIASLSINPLMPNVRFWLPVGEDVNPSRSMHATGAFLLIPDQSWRLRFEGYYKWQPHLLVIDYERATSNPSQFGAPIESQNDMLIGADGFGYGAAIAIEKQTEFVTASARYEYSVAEQRIPNRFDGASLTVPWNVPHRITTSFDVALNSDFTLVGRIENRIGQAWAYRDAYYNFLEPSDVFGEFGIYDLSDPTSHKLPMITQIDLGLSYTKDINTTRLQVRLDMANLLSSSNVDEWVLVHNPTTNQFSRVERSVSPFLPSLTVRVGW